VRYCLQIYPKPKFGLTIFKNSYILFVANSLKFAVQKVLETKNAEISIPAIPTFDLAPLADYWTCNMVDSMESA
jgi:hypothetical protein